MTDRVNVKNLKIKLRLSPRHLAVTAALLGGFLVMASVFAPDQLQAGAQNSGVQSRANRDRHLSISKPSDPKGIRTPVPRMKT